jgi:predicted nucleic acid-binding protein
MVEDKSPLVFLDANVLIEAAIVQAAPAVAIMHLAATGVLALITCHLVIDDVEDEILDRAAINPGEVDNLINSWQQLLDRTELKITNNPSIKLVLETKKKYLASMRHLADIPVLASAIEVQANLILSGNREHFNNKTSKKCGIPIYSCHEFLRQFTSVI